jgi:hypothetical protein
MLTAGGGDVDDSHQRGSYRLADLIRFELHQCSSRQQPNDEEGLKGVILQGDDLRRLVGLHTRVWPAGGPATSFNTPTAAD